MPDKLTHKMGVVRVTWPKFEILDIKQHAPKFVREYAICLRMKNLPRSGLGHVTLLKNLEPAYIFGTVKCGHSAFGKTYICHSMTV